MRRTVAAVTAMAAVLMAGCGPQTAVSPTPSPSPTFMCTPEAGGSEAPCSEQDYQKMKAKDALYAEAEQVYRTYQAEFLKVIRAGGADQLTPELKVVVGSDDVEKAIVAELKNFKNSHLSITGPGAQIVDAVRKPGLVRGDSVVTMAFCIDSRKTKIRQNGKSIGGGVLGVETTYFSRIDNTLKMTYIDGKEVKKC